jgi:hypothetical protein
MKRTLLLLMAVLLLAACARDAGRGPLGSPATGNEGQPASGCVVADPSDVMVCLRGGEQSPEATLFVGVKRFDGAAGSSCWTTVSGGQGVGQCIDTVWPPEIDRYIEIERGTEIAVLGDAGTAELSLAEPRSGDHVAKVALEDGRGRITAKPGKYLLNVFATWSQGDAAFGFGIRVVEPDQSAG